MRVDWLADAFRQAGLDVVEYGSWAGHGRSLSRVEAVIVHDTVTTDSWSDPSVAKLLRDGRSGLPGPLAQTGPDRDGRQWVIADGRCNHNGYGTHGNNTVGIETFCAGGMAGREEPWNAAQYESNVVAAAVILKRCGLPASRVLGHKEADPRRKIDPYNVAMARFRSDVADQLAGTPGTGDEEMKRGDKGNHVKRLQWRINQTLHGHHDPENGGLTVDGVFGASTEAYVKHVQSQAGYPTTGRVEWWTYDWLSEVAHLKTSHK